MEFEKNFLHSCGSGYGCSGSCEEKDTCCEELLETQRVEITDQNGVKSTHTAISEAIETNNKLDEVISEKDGVKSIRTEVTIPPVEIDKTGLATEARQDATITAINDAKTEIVNAINGINVTVDLSATNQILTDIKNQEQTNADALLTVANDIKALADDQPNKVEITAEVDRIVAAVQAGGSQIDYTTQLTDIIAKLDTVATNTNKDYTNQLDALKTALNEISDKIDALVGQYNQALADLKTELQAINQNTDTVEALIQELIDKPGYDDTTLQQLISDLNVMLKAESNQTQELLQSIGCSVIPVAEGYFTNTAKTRIGLKMLNPLENNLFTMVTSITPATITKDTYSSSLSELYLNVPNPLPGTPVTQIVLNTSIGGVTGTISYNIKDVDGILVVERASGCAKQNMSITQTNIMSNAYMETQIKKLEVIADVNEAKKDINKKVSLPTTNELLGTNGIMGVNVVTDLMMQNTGASGNVIITNNGVTYTLVPDEVRYHSGTRDYSGQTYTVENGAIFELNFARKV